MSGACVVGVVGSGVGGVLKIKILCLKFYAFNWQLASQSYQSISMDKMFTRD